MSLRLSRFVYFVDDRILEAAQRVSNGIHFVTGWHSLLQARAIAGAAAAGWLVTAFDAALSIFRSADFALKLFYIFGVLIGSFLVLYWAGMMFFGFDGIPGRLSGFDGDAIIVSAAERGFRNPRRDLMREARLLIFFIGVFFGGRLADASDVALVCIGVYYVWVSLDVQMPRPAWRFAREGA